MRLGSMIAGTVWLLCAGSAVAQSREAAMTPPGNPECRDYTVQPAVDGKPASVVGHACHAPDGRWQVVGAAPHSQAGVPAIGYPPPVVYYPYGSWLIGPPPAFSGGSFVFFGRRQLDHFHAFPQFHRFSPRFHRFSRFVPRFHGVPRHHFGGFGMRSFGVSRGHR